MDLAEQVTVRPKRHQRSLNQPNTGAEDTVAVLISC